MGNDPWLHTVPRSQQESLRDFSGHLKTLPGEESLPEYFPLFLENMASLLWSYPEAAEMWQSILFSNGSSITFSTKNY